MAYVTKTINGTTSSSSLWTFKVVVTETAINTAEKTSTVRLEAFLGRLKNVGSSYFAGTYKLTLSINGDTYKYSESLYKNATVGADSYVSLGSATFVVEQTTTPLTVKINGSMSTSSFNPNSASISETSVTLTKLHEAPVLSSMKFEETNSILTATGIGGDYFVPHLSVKKITATPTLYDNATLTKTRIINESNSYSSASGTPNVVTMDLRTKTLYTTHDKGLNRTVPKLSVEFTDSTGAIAEWAYPHTYLIPYTKPNLIATASSVKRNGQISGKVNLNLTGTFYNSAIGNKSNTISLSFKYWKQGTSEPTTYYTIPASVYTISGDNVIISNWNMSKNGTVISDVSKDSSYRFKIKAVDAFNMTQEIELTCAKGEWLMARFKDRIDFKKVTIQNAPIADFVVEQGVNYIKWNSGKLEQWHYKGVNPVSITEQTGGVYKGTVALGDWDVPFSETPDKFTATISWMNTNRNVWLGGPAYANDAVQNPTTTSCGTFNIFSTYSTDVYGSITIHAIGKWK